MRRKQGQRWRSQLLMGAVALVGGLLLGLPLHGLAVYSDNNDRLLVPSPLVAMDPPPFLSGCGCCFGWLVRSSCFGAARIWAMVIPPLALFAGFILINGGAL